MFQEWIALVGNGGISIIASDSERLPIIFRNSDPVSCFLLGQHATSNEAYQSFVGNPAKKELDQKEMEDILVEIMPANCMI